MDKIINGGYARYLSELPEFQNGLPHGIVTKTKQMLVVHTLPQTVDQIISSCVRLGTWWMA